MINPLSDTLQQSLPEYPMTDEAWAQLHADFNRLQKIKGRKARAEEKRLMEIRQRCRHCGKPCQDFYMMRSDLWTQIASSQYGATHNDGYAYGSGYLCIECAAARLYPRQLYNTDFHNQHETDEDGDPVPGLNSQELDWTDAGYSYGIVYTITFPNEGGEPVVRVSDITYGVSRSDDGKHYATLPDDEWTDAVWEQLFDHENEHLGWLPDYCLSHKLRLVWDGEEVNLTAPDVDPSQAAATG